YNSRTSICAARPTPMGLGKRRVHSSASAREPMGFACEEDARRVLDVLPKRFGKYGLTLHTDKTRLGPFEPPAPGKLPTPREAWTAGAPSPCSVSPPTGAVPERGSGWGSARRPRAAGAGHSR